MGKVAISGNGEGTDDSYVMSDADVVMRGDSGEPTKLELVK